MEKKIFTIPNIITMCRIVIIVFAGRYLLLGDIINSFILYLIAIITDFLDGFLARGLKQVTNLGKILDPIADKLMIGSAILILIYKDMMPVWYGVVVIGCSVINLIGGLILIKKYKYVPSAILIGKFAAVGVMLSFLFNIVLFLRYEETLFYFYILSSILLVASVVVYEYKSYNQLKTKKRR